MSSREQLAPRVKELIVRRLKLDIDPAILPAALESPEVPASAPDRRPCTCSSSDCSVLNFALDERASSFAAISAWSIFLRSEAS